MKMLSPLVLPLVLGAAAAFLNASILRSRLEPVTLVRIIAPIEAGTFIRPDDLRPIQVRDPSQTLGQSFWTWEDRERLFGVPVPTALQEEQMVPRTLFDGGVRRRIEIPIEHAIVGVRVEPEAMGDFGSPKLFLPHSRVTISMVDIDEPLGSFEVAMCDREVDEAGNTVGYELFVAVPVDESQALESLVTNSVARVRKTE